MDELINQTGNSGGVMVVLVPTIIQILKKFPFIVKMQADGVPIYQLLSIGLSIGGAYAMGTPMPLMTGIISGLAAGKGYDIVKGTGK